MTLSMQEKLSGRLKLTRKMEFFPGQKLILTFETLQDGLDMKVVESLVKEYLL